MRVYLAASAADVQELAASGGLGTALEGFAATPELVARLELEGEELELALADAAAESARQAAVDGGTTTGRRLVVVAELPASSVAVEPGDDGSVRLVGRLEIGQVDAVLADVVPIDLTGAADDALAWFASQEIDRLC